MALLLPGNYNRYRTFLGSCLTIFTFVLISAYFGFQMAEMFANADYSTQLQIQEDVFSSDDPFDTDEIGFTIAVGITDYKESTNLIEDPTYGEVKIFRKHWNSPENVFTTFSTVGYKQCTENDFNWGGERVTDKYSKFYPMTENAKTDVEKFGFRLKCLTESFELYGDYDASIASNLFVAFVKCDPSTG